jgi:CheY-like chemotaxis protein
MQVDRRIGIHLAIAPNFLSAETGAKTMKAAGTILIVDDEQSVRRFVHTVLDHFGYERLLQTDRADRALEIAQNVTPIQLLLSDIDLGGGIDGIQLARLITGFTPDAKVLLISGRSKPVDVEPGWQFLPKPFAASELLVAVRRILESTIVQSRQATAKLTAFTLDLNKKIIPAGATLEGFRIGPGHEGLLPQNPNVASFHYGGEVLFNMAHEIVKKTRIAAESKHLHAA